MSTLGKVPTHFMKSRLILFKRKKKKSKNQRPTTAVQSYESKQKTDSILIAKQLKKLEGIPITAF